MKEQWSRLSRPAILRAMEQGRIFIKPFNPENLGSAQYDVRLGEWYFRERRSSESPAFFNPFSEDDVERVWGTEALRAQPHGEWAQKHNNGRRLIIGTKKKHHLLGDDELIIWIGPGETILAHTIEFIGGCDTTITTQMHARSSWGRSFIEVCKCAGVGDIGFHNRWTMEITNNSSGQKIPLIVGVRIAQFTFHETESVGKEDSYEVSGKYQRERAPQALIGSWDPNLMLKPRLYADREVKEPGGFRQHNIAPRK